jgi:hypothetical protein
MIETMKIPIPSPIAFLLNFPVMVRDRHSSELLRLT